ncbi:MAG: hypothetical protein EOO81_06165 [Oxalobacteraceae bacterium]|nr:MAG: hypothetical protein EOO81_06165 [Oxalobacteraceae bacterium]
MSNDNRTAGAMVCVWMDVDRNYDEELNDWYETEHVHDIVGIDGFLSGRRYYDDTHRLRYLVLYEARDASVEPGPGFQGAVARPTKWTERIRRLFGENRRRSNFRLLAEAGTPVDAPAIVTVDRKGLAEPAEAEERRAASAGCIRYRSYVDVNAADAGFEIFEYVDKASATKAIENLRAETRNEVSMRLAIGVPHFHRAVNV